MSFQGVKQANQYLRVADSHTAVANAVQTIPPTTGDKNPFMAGASDMAQTAQLVSSAGSGKTQLGQ